MARFSRKPEDTTRPRPFLKWAGGKGQLLAELRTRLPASFNAYHEPFLGGAALFFELSARGCIPGGAFLSDLNPVLIEAYTVVRDDVEALIEALAPHANREDHFYATRALDPATLTPVQRTARVIYLNRTCYNGLYRENSSGRFNVPFGRYVNPTICDRDTLRAASEALRGVDLSQADFQATVARAAPGDLVYFDPPYQPVSATSSFTAYHRDGFGEDRQLALRTAFATLAARGVHVLLSNSDTPFVRRLYAGFRIDSVRANRAINSRADRRGTVGEVIVVGGPTA
jgi:DNA adenine methylase